MVSVPTLRMGKRMLVGPALLEDAADVMRLALEAFDDA